MKKEQLKQEVEGQVREILTDSQTRNVYFDYGNALMNLLGGLYQVGTGVLARSPLGILHGVYFVGNAAAIKASTSGIQKKNEDNLIRSTKISGYVLMGMALVYILCVFGTRGDLGWDKYPSWIGWGVWIVSMGQLFWNLFQVWYNARKDNWGYWTISILNLATSGIGLVLIQSCLLYSAHIPVHPIWNMLVAVFFGLLSGGLGAYLVWYAHQKQDELARKRSKESKEPASE